MDPRAIIAHLTLIKAGSADFSDVSLAPLLEVFQELRKLTAPLGYLFDMAMSDITVKCDFIRELLKKTGIEQASVEILIVYEKSLKGDFNATATRKLLALIRALEFVAILLDNLQGPMELGMAIRDAYWKTIAKYHTYLIQGGVVTASYTAPYKNIYFASLNLGTADPVAYCAELAPLLHGLYDGLKALYVREKCF